MSKQSDAKRQQKYKSRHVLPSCANCVHFRSRLMEFTSFSGRKWTEEKRLRCSLGGFAIVKSGLCDSHVFEDGSVFYLITRIQESEADAARMQFLRHNLNGLDCAIDGAICAE